jgi:hypothetical protein
MRIRVEKKTLVVVGFAVIAAILGLETIKWCLQQRARVPCNCNLMMISCAIQAYRADHAFLPPAYTTDSNGKPLHSWRVLLLPYIGSEELYRQIDFDAPWNSTINLRLAECEPTFYRCPADRDTGQTATNYVVVLDANGLWPGGKSAKLATDASDLDKVLVLEIAGSDIPWMEPRDVTVREVLGDIQPEEGRRSGHLRAVAYITVAGEICILNNKSDRDLLYKRLVAGEGDLN